MSLEAAAHEWMAKHPDVFAVFEHMALEAASRGRRFGMKALAEVVRWHVPFAKGDDEEWKICNNHIAYIGRELIDRHPWIRPYITTRRAGTDL